MFSLKIPPPNTIHKIRTGPRKIYRVNLHSFLTEFCMSAVFSLHLCVDQHQVNSVVSSRLTEVSLVFLSRNYK